MATDDPVDPDRHDNHDDHDDHGHHGDNGHHGQHSHHGYHEVHDDLVMNWRCLKLCISVFFCFTFTASSPADAIIPESSLAAGLFYHPAGISPSHVFPQYIKDFLKDKANSGNTR